MEELEDLGFDPKGYSIDFSDPDARILKVLGQCAHCGLARLAYRDKETGDYIPARCPRRDEPVSNACLWGGRNGTLGEI